MTRMHRQRLVAILLSFTFTTTSALAATASNPFAFGASVGPAASSRIDARVTRTVDGKRVTLPAAAVPALQAGDEVVMRFPDYTRPPAKVNYHVNVAFITETPPLGWLYPRSTPADRLFATPNRRRNAKPAPPPELRFTYGQGERQGIPIFFIVPEDGKTRGMDGVRDYVGAHPTDFKDMSVSSNDAVERYSWFRDFLSSLAQGSFDPISQQQRVVAIASSLGASPDDVNACYVSGASSSSVANCIQTALLSVQYNTNIEAPTQAQFFGGAAGAAMPAQLALYLEPLLAVWKIFSQYGHKEYEYLPTTLRLVNSSQQLLMGLKVPTLRPPAAYSSVLFFTIGDPSAVTNPPAVVNDDKGTGVCASTPRVNLPLHLDRTSQYVNDTALVFTGESGASTLRVPVDPRNAAAPVVDRSRLSAGHGYDVKLMGRFGFDPIDGSQRAVAHVAVPGDAKWAVSTMAYRPVRSGGDLDAIASSEVAPCLTGAELQMGGNAPVALKITRLDDRRIELTGSLKSVPAGTAELRFYQDDGANHRRIADTTTFAIQPQAAQVAGTPAAFAGDRAILLQGSGLDGVHAIRIGSNVYAKSTDLQTDAACFTGPPLAAHGSVSTQLLPDGGAPGEVFTLDVGPPRPQLAQLTVAPSTPQHLQSDQLTLTLSSGATPLPRRFDVRLRQAPAAPSPCDALRDDETAVVVPAADVHRTAMSALTVTLRAGDVLHDAALGTLQAQIVDTVSKLQSDWVDIPGQFSYSSL